MTASENVTETGMATEGIEEGGTTETSIGTATRRDELTTVGKTLAVVHEVEVLRVALEIAPESELLPMTDVLGVQTILLPVLVGHPLREEVRLASS